MLNTKLYKKVHSLAEQLLKAAQKEDVSTFDNLYKELNTLCLENESNEKNHPVQWETLADFTEDSDEALVLYKKALAFAEETSAHDYIASINYAMAVMLKECGDNAQALLAVQQANTQLDKIGDSGLQQEITDLLASLQ